MNRKGDVSVDMIVVVILAIVGFFVLLGIANIFANKLPDQTATLLCKNTITARANVALNIQSINDKYIKMKTTPLLCRSYDVKISGTKQEVMQKLADLMTTCWWEFSEGKYDYTIEDFFSGDTCFPCFSVTIQDITDKGVSTIEWTEYEDWLRTNKYVAKNITYYEYLTNYQDIPGQFMMFSNIEKKKVYYILYSDPQGGLNIAGEHNVPNGLYFSDVNSPPETWTQFKITNPFGELKQCKIITGAEGE